MYGVTRNTYVRHKYDQISEKEPVLLSYLGSNECSKTVVTYCRYVVKSWLTLSANLSLNNVTAQSCLKGFKKVLLICQ